MIGFEHPIIVLKIMLVRKSLINKDGLLIKSSINCSSNVYQNH